MKSSGYQATIGIECHVQLSTVTKLFAAVSNDARDAKPNTLISHICLGMPGALPVLNEKAVEMGAKAAFALGTSPQLFSKFDRKHYFYPDLPKGYQITQYEQPIVIGGFVEIETNGIKKRIGITRAHLEEDAGKNTHPAGKDYTLVDLNRAGTPLLEIVSEPDIKSPEEAKAYAHELYLIVKYAGISDADLYHGNMRFDVNVSVSNDPKKLGIRTETKNLNSFRSVEKAAEYEIKRQIENLKKDELIVQETRGWDDTKQRTFSQRGKEEAHDYRYMPEPDIPPIVLDTKLISEIKASMPIMPKEWRQRLVSLGLDQDQINVLLEAEVEGEHTSHLSLVEKYLNQPERAKRIINWLVNVEIPATDWEVPEEKRLKVYEVLLELIDANKLSSTAAKSLLLQLIDQKAIPDNLEKYAEEQGYTQVSDEDEISRIVDEILAENPTAAEDVKNGELKAIGFLVGQVMKKSLGKANPELTQELIKKKLA